MDMPGGNSLYSDLKEPKISFFFLFLPFLYKVGEQEDGTGPSWQGFVPGGGGKIVKDGEFGANTVYTCK
jgi:hypothetical protein